MIKLILKDFERCRKFFIGMTITLAVLIFAVVNSGDAKNIDNPEAFALLPGIYFFIIVYICFLRNISKEYKYNTTNFLESLPVKPSEVIAAKFLFPFIINMGLFILCIIFYKFLPGEDGIAWIGRDVIIYYASINLLIIGGQYLGITFIGYKPTFIITFVLAMIYLVYNYLIPVITRWGELDESFLDSSLNTATGYRGEIYTYSIVFYFIVMFGLIIKRNFKSRVKNIFDDMKSGNLENMFK